MNYSICLIDGCTGKRERERVLNYIGPGSMYGGGPSFFLDRTRSTMYRNRSKGYRTRSYMHIGEALCVLVIFFIEHAGELCTCYCDNQGMKQSYISPISLIPPQVAEVNSPGHLPTNYAVLALHRTYLKAKIVQNNRTMCQQKILSISEFIYCMNSLLKNKKQPC